MEPAEEPDLRLAAGGRTRAGLVSQPCFSFKSFPSPSGDLRCTIGGEAALVWLLASRPRLAGAAQRSYSDSSQARKCPPASASRPGTERQAGSQSQPLGSKL